MPSKLKEVKNSLKILETIQFHRDAARMSRDLYNKQRSDKDFLRDNLLIDIDFKQKIILGN